MLANIRRILTRLLPCAAVLFLLALPGPSRPQLSDILRRLHEKGRPAELVHDRGKGRWRREPSSLPDRAAQWNSREHVHTRGVLTCQPGDGAACMATRECPGSGAICDRHPNPVEPVGSIC